VMIAYLRPLLVASYVQDIQRMKGAITIKTLSPGNYLQLLAIIVVVHHSLVFFLEAFTFGHFGYTLLQILLSGVLSFAFILMFEYLRKNT